jgi:hypothetical protein
LVLIYIYIDYRYGYIPIRPYKIEIQITTGDESAVTALFELCSHQHCNRIIFKVMGRGGRKKIAQGKQKKKNRAPRKFEKKYSCRDFSIGKL